jgi:hypothetical protein
MAEKVSQERRSPALRSRRRLTVHYGPQGPSHIGYSGNISRSGMMIRTTRVFEPGTILAIEVELTGRKLSLRGQVVWARIGEVRWLTTGKIGMGIRFLQPPENLMELVSLVAV